MVEGEIVGPYDGMELPELASLANQFHIKVEDAGRSMLKYAWSAGQALLAAKARVKHGDWLPWLSANFQGSERTAQLYLKIANTQSAADLDATQSIAGALKALRKPVDKPSADEESDDEVHDLDADVKEPEPTPESDRRNAFSDFLEWADEGDQIVDNLAAYAPIELTEEVQMLMDAWVILFKCLRRPTTFVVPGTVEGVVDRFKELDAEEVEIRWAVGVWSGSEEADA